MSVHKRLAELQQANFVFPDPGASGAIKITENFAHIELTSAAAETRTLAAPTKSGIRAILSMTTDGGDITVTTASAYDENGSTTITFSEAGQYVELLSVAVSTSAWQWRVVGFDGVAGPVRTTDVALGDEVDLTFGAPDVTMRWDTSDANANKLLVQFPTATAVNVPVIVYGAGLVDVDMAIHDGVVSPLVSYVGTGATATGPVIEARKARGTAAAPTVVTTGDDVLSIRGFAAVASGEWVQTAEIRMDCAGTIATTRGPGTITFATATDAAPSALTSALVIGANQVVVPQLGITPKSGTAAAITTTRTLTAQDSGCAFSVAKTSAYAITLPTPAQGIRFKFLVLDTGANIVTISNGSAHLSGAVSINNTLTAMTGTTLGLASGGSVGDWVEFEGIDATHYLVTGACIAASDITIT